MYIATKLLALSIVLSGIAKIIIDLALFFVSYQIQKRWVLSNGLGGSYSGKRKNNIDDIDIVDDFELEDIDDLIHLTF